MDIQISSNFERFLYYLSGELPDQLCQWMNTFQQTGKFNVPQKVLQKAQEEMSTVSVSEEETLTTIREYYEKYRYLLDPHTAVGVRAIHQWSNETPQICLATAHPAKFGDAVKTAIGFSPALPPDLSALQNQKTRYQILPATVAAVKHVIVQELQ